MRRTPSTRRSAPVLLCLLALLLVLAACDQQNQQSPQPTPTTEAATAVATAAPTTLPDTPTTRPQPTVPPTPDTPEEGEFVNPVIRADFADPFVLTTTEGIYYAYATNASGKNIQVAKSTDLVKWDMLVDAMPALPTWAKLGGSLVWAPEVMHIGDKYVLYYTARDKESNKQCVGVATSDKPEGRYVDSNDKPFVCQADQGGTIDASPFRDGDKLYLYYKNDGNCCNMATWLYVQEMAPDGLSLVGEPVQLVRNDRAWEGGVVEAPTMWKHDGKYYLFFSANNYAGMEYAVGYATCQSVMGPCEDAPENPILKSHMDVRPPIVGPGHQTITVDDDGETWLVYHVWEITSAGLRGNNRNMWIDKLVWEGDRPVVNGPTTSPQEVP
jgi:beta-xylosidase